MRLISPFLCFVLAFIAHAALAQVPSNIVQDTFRKIDMDTPQQADKRKAMEEKIPYLENTITNYNQCLRQSGAKGRSKLQQQGRTMQYKIKQLCDAKKDDEANQYMLQMRAEMLQNPDYLKLQHCNNSIISAFGGSPDMMQRIHAMPACEQVQMMGSLF